MDLPEIPARHAELVELEARHRSIRAQRRELDVDLQNVEVELSRRALERDGEKLDDLASQLADGRIDRLTASNLPGRRDDLLRQLEVVRSAEAKLGPKLAREREHHANRIVRAFRPHHKAAARRILAAVEELVAANAVEAEVRQACPVSLVNISFPNVGDFSANNARSAKLWREGVGNLGFFDPDPPPKPEPKPSALSRLVPRRARANGAAEPAPALVAKATDQ